MHYLTTVENKFRLVEKLVELILRENPCLLKNYINNTEKSLGSKCVSPTALFPGIATGIPVPILGRGNPGLLKNYTHNSHRPGLQVNF